MTDEEIKQNAGIFASFGRESFQPQKEYELLVEGYIAGAHSRDEEIEKLKERLMLADESIADADKWIAKYKLDIANLEAKLDQLRNPWISVKERRPNYPESEYDIDNMYLVCREGNSIAFPAIFRRNGKWYIYDNMQTVEIIAPDYWMPMPVKKGE